MERGRTSNIERPTFKVEVGRWSEANERATLWTPTEWLPGVVSLGRVALLRGKAAHNAAVHSR